MLQKIMELLENGNMIRINDCDLVLTPDSRYITYYHFGSSARLKSLDNLYWILAVIAEVKLGDRFYINKDRSHYLPDVELCDSGVTWEGL